MKAFAPEESVADRDDSDMNRSIEAHDWASTALGPIEHWPAALRITVSTMINSAFPKCLCWGDALIMVYNDAFVPILGNKHPCLGQPFLEVWAEAADDIGPIARQALAGKSTFIEDFPLLISRGQAQEQTYFTFCYSPIKDENGRVCGMLDTVIETTDKVKAEQLSKLRNQELVHRSRNAYALVSALVNQTFRDASDPREIKRELTDRLGALVRAQDVLMESGSGGQSIAALCERALEPFLDGTDRITISGPDLAIGREQVTALGLALHELATNAVKYGALSTASGTVTLSWSVSATPVHPEATVERFCLSWQETGGPAVDPPERRGFGSRIIGHTLPDAFRGTVSTEYAETGFVLTLNGDSTLLTKDEDPLGLDLQLPSA